MQTTADADTVDAKHEVAKLGELIAERNKAEAVMFGHLKKLGYVTDWRLLNASDFWAYILKQSAMQDLLVANVFVPVFGWGIYCNSFCAGVGHASTGIIAFGNTHCALLVHPAV